MIKRVLVVGDDYGIPLTLSHLSHDVICGMAVAGIRPQQHEVLREIAEKMKLPFMIQPRFKSGMHPEFVEQVRDLNVDLIFVNSYSMLLRPEVLAVSKYGGVNVHGGLLPEYRGASPLQWAILNDEKVTGVTMHYMNEHFDSGDIIAQRRVPIRFEDTWCDAHARIAVATGDMLEQELPKLLLGTVTRRPQDESQAKHWPRRYPKDGLIDWKWSALRIYNQIRALVKPLPGAFYINGEGQHIVLDEFMTLWQVVELKRSMESTQ